MIKRALRIVVLGPMWLIMAAVLALFAPLLLFFSWVADDGVPIGATDLKDMIVDLAKQMGLGR